MSYRRLSTVAALLAVCLAVATIGAQLQAHPSGPQRLPPAARQQLPPEGIRDEGPCERVLEDECRELVSRGRSRRYLLIPPETQGASEGPRSAVLVDAGGPGSVLFAPGVAGRVRDALGDRVQDRWLLLLEEPWVTAEVTPQCREALSRLYEAARASLSAAGPSALRLDECHLGSGAYGWRADHYVPLVEEILERESLTLEGFVGLSFGAVRSTYASELGIEWRALVRPAPAPGSSAGFLIDTRVDAAVDQLLERCKDCSGRSALLDRIRAAMASLDRGPLSLDSRSVPVTGFDLASGLLVLASAPANQEVDLADILLRPQDWSDAIGGLSDQLWMRSGETDLSLAYLAYLEEVCPTYQGWRQDGTPETVLHQTFALAHSPCEAGTTSPAPSTLVTGHTARTCIVLDDGDVVSPSEFGETWSSHGGGDAIANHAGRHWFEGVEECLARIGVGES